MDVNDDGIFWKEIVEILQHVGNDGENWEKGEGVYRHMCQQRVSFDYERLRGEFQIL